MGNFLYYACVVNSIVLVDLSAIASEKSCPTKSTMEKVDKFLDYARERHGARHRQRCLVFE